MPDTPPADSAKPRRKTRWWEYVIVVVIFGFLAAILIPVVGSGPPHSRPSMIFTELNNILSMCKLYHQEYGHWPTLTKDPPPDRDFVLNLRTASPLFLRVMTGNFTGHPAEAVLNPRQIQFGTFSDRELSQNGTSVVDAYGNDQIVIIMDTDDNKFIAPFTYTFTNSEGKPITLRQTIPVHSDCIVFSLAQGLSDNDIITTWDVQ